MLYRGFTKSTANDLGQIHNLSNIFLLHESLISTLLKSTPHLITENKTKLIKISSISC